MKFQNLLVACSLLLLMAGGCIKEYSQEGNEKIKSDTLAVNYPFATGYCNGTGASLGIFIVDTSNFVPASANPLPTVVLLDMPAAGNQGSQGSCAAWATVYDVGSYYTHIKTGKPYSDTGNLSPKFTYNQIAKGNCGCTSILENLYLLKTQGASTLRAMPYSADECLKQPDSLQKMNADGYKVTSWGKIDLHNLGLIKRAVLEKKPVLFAISIDDGFKSIAAPYLWKERAGATGSAHALAIVGYDDSKNAFRIMNSWSSAWGDNGFIWIDYNFFLINVLEGGYVVI